MGWLSYYREPRAETNAEHFGAKLSEHFSFVAHGTVEGVFYAAVHDARTDEVWAYIVLTQWRRGDFNFAYKDMDETCGCDAKAPRAVLDALTPTTSKYALAWREQCRQYHAQREFLVKHLRFGMRVRLARPLAFTDGTTRDTFTYTRAAKRGPGYLKADGVRYSIRGWRDRVVAVIDANGDELATPAAGSDSAAA